MKLNKVNSPLVSVSINPKYKSRLSQQRVVQMQIGWRVMMKLNNFKNHVKNSAKEIKARANRDQGVDQLENKKNLKNKKRKRKERIKNIDDQDQAHQAGKKGEIEIMTDKRKGDIEERDQILMKEVIDTVESMRKGGMIELSFLILDL